MPIRTGISNGTRIRRLRAMSGSISAMKKLNNDGRVGLWMDAEAKYCGTAGARGLTRSDKHYFQIADNATVSTGDIDFTLAFWVRFTSLPVDDQFVVAKWNESGSSREYYVRYKQSVDRLQGAVSTDGTDAVTVDADNHGGISIDTWYFVVLEHDATANTLTISVNDGTADSTAHSGGVFDGTAMLQVGAKSGAVESYADVGVSKIALFKSSPPKHTADPNTCHLCPPQHWNLTILLVPLNQSEIDIP